VSVLSVAVLGASGRMGRQVVAQVLASPDLRLAAAVTRPGSASIGQDAGTVAGERPAGVPIAALGPLCFDGADVVVDFSLPEALAAALPHLGALPLVSGTTGLPAELNEQLTTQARRAPVLHAANFSTGVTLLLHLAAQAARALPDYDVEIVETHHRLKQDAPSGTALALGQAVAKGRGVDLAAVSVHGRSGRPGVRPAGEIGFHALRGGDVVGEHTVWLLGGGERISLGHSASSRSTFAAGAVRAARWLQSRPAGRYTMADVLGLSASG
jgi:4-hydroxy-tetrahydrodipicolinate reductase